MSLSAHDMRVLRELMRNASIDQAVAAVRENRRLKTTAEKPTRYGKHMRMFVSWPIDHEPELPEVSPRSVARRAGTAGDVDRNGLRKMPTSRVSRP